MVNYQEITGKSSANRKIGKEGRLKWVQIEKQFKNVSIGKNNSTQEKHDTDLSISGTPRGKASRLNQDEDFGSSCPPLGSLVCLLEDYQEKPDTSSVGANISDMTKS